MDNEKEKYQLVINFEGNDMLVEVESLEVATCLINNPEAAERYVQHLIEKEEQEQWKEKNNGKYEGQPQEQSSNIPIVEQSVNTLIWSTKKTTKKDNDATVSLLELRKKFSSQFADKVTRNAKLWSDIGRQLTEKGFDLGENPGEKCRQKFSNLQKSYTKYILNQKTTGSQKMETPPFFEEINEILGEQHKVNPVCLMDTEENISVKPKLSTNDQPSTSASTPSGSQFAESDIENRFSKKQKFKRYSKTNDLIKEIQEDRKERSEQFEFFKQHLKKSEQQRDKLLSILEKSIRSTNKRKRNSSSDSD